VRAEFHRQLGQLEERLVENAEQADAMLGDAVTAMRSRDEAAAREVVARDALVDERYLEVQRGVIRALALQAPVASDLRLVSAILHVNIHLERMGDYATSVAKMAARSAEYPDEPELARQIDDMAEHARDVGRVAMRSFAQRDAELAATLPELDDAVDQLNRGIFHRLVQLASEDPSRVDWAERVLITPRFIERYGDHAVDVGEQVIFLVTGETVELSSNEPGGA
jgi:phosphate transport system protein